MHFAYMIIFCTNQTHEHCGKWQLYVSEAQTTVDRKQNRNVRRDHNPPTQANFIGDFATVEYAAAAIAKDKAKRSSPPWEE
jgi:hypothetical protein